MRVLLTEAAENDLRFIALQIARDKMRRSKSFEKALKDPCLELGDKPLRFERLDGYPNLRRRPFGNYLTIYQVAAAHVTIVRIVHGARNQGGLDFSARS